MGFANGKALSSARSVLSVLVQMKYANGVCQWQGVAQCSIRPSSPGATALCQWATWKRIMWGSPKRPGQAMPACELACSDALAPFHRFVCVGCFSCCLARLSQDLVLGPLGCRLPLCLPSLSVWWRVCCRPAPRTVPQVLVARAPGGFHVALAPVSPSSTLRSVAHAAPPRGAVCT